MDRINPDLVMDVLSLEAVGSPLFNDIEILGEHTGIFQSYQSMARSSTARKAFMDRNFKGPNRPAGSSTDGIHSSFQKILRKVNNKNSKFQRAIFQKQKNYLNLTAKMFSNSNIYNARVRITPHRSDAVNRLIIQFFSTIYDPRLKYNFNGTDHIYTSRNMERKKRYLVGVRVRDSINKTPSLFLVYVYNVQMFSTRFENNKSVLFRTIKTSIPLINNESELLLNFDFLRSSYLNRHSDPTLLNFWENIVLSWKPIQITDGDNYELLEKYLSHRFNLDLNSELDENNFQIISDYLKQMTILNTTPNERNFMRECTIIGLIKTGNALRIEYDDFGEIRQSDSIFNYYVNKRKYVLQNLTIVRSTTEHNRFSLLPTQSRAFDSRLIQLGFLTNITLKVIQVISGLTNDQYRTLQNKIQIDKYKQKLNLNQFYHQIYQQQ